MEKRLGKIEKVHFGLGGYHDAMIGYSFTLSGEGWGVCTQWKGFWIQDYNPNSKWEHQDRLNTLGQTILDLGQTLLAAKKTDIKQLVGVPIEATFDGNVLHDWRILTEVL